MDDEGEELFDRGSDLIREKEGGKGGMQDSCEAVCR